ncbi:MAG: HNH endonuclease signature motif containing protein [Ignavibacteria bacterium]|nr:HNH endonuclease signature motif containing protein [Ignavibacteria bacterium]
MKRANDKCEKCGQEPQAWRNGIWGIKADGISSDDGISGDITQKDTMLEVHHIIPIGGEQRYWNRKNVPENLICLCYKCHKAMT